MDNRLLGALIVIVILGGAALILMLQPSGPDTVKAKFCGMQAAKVYSCGQGVYEIATLPDVGTSYVDSGGSVLAQCNGFINKPEPPGCATYSAYPCDRTKNLCVQ